MTQQNQSPIIDEAATAALNSMSYDDLMKLAAAKKRQEEAGINSYKALASETVGSIIMQCTVLSTELSIAKASIFRSIATLIKLRHETYGTKHNPNQQSYTFSDSNGNSITIGYRMIDDFDDTVEEGIQLVNEYIQTLAQDKASAELVGYIFSLLKRDRKGNLDAKSVLNLQNEAEKKDHPVFKKGVEIIVKARKQKRSLTFVDAYTTDANGAKINIPLSMSAVDFPEDFNFVFGEATLN